MKYLEQTWRWFGPNDPVTLDDVRQTGAVGVVSALHHVPNGEVWELDEILKRKNLIESKGLKWSVVESVPVHEDIKKQKPGFERYIENYQCTLRNLSKAGITTVCYNFMPVLDWTRTDLSFTLPDGAKALRFDPVALAAFDIHILERKNAHQSYTDDRVEKAHVYFDKLSKIEIEQLRQNILAGLPGAEEGYSLAAFSESLEEYESINEEKLRKHLYTFVRLIGTTADQLGINLSIHPDDPPFSIFGLPRIVSTEDDIRLLMQAYDSPRNGICFCTGSLGVRKDNDLTGIIKRWGSRIHFVHLRSTRQESDGSFYEADHLDGDVNMPAIMQALVREQQQRNDAIPFRPDHGHQMLDDLKKKTNPGYSAIGRLRGLAELRGLETGIHFAMNRQIVL